MEVIPNGSNGSKKFLISIDTQKIIDALKNAEDRFIPYETLSGLIGRDIQTTARHCLNTAQRRLLRDHSELWVAEPGKGVKRLTDSEKVQQQGKRIRHTYRTARRGMQEGASVKNFDAMNPEDKKAHNFNMSILGAMAQMTSAGKVRALKAKMEAAPQLLPLAKTLELFK